MPEYIVSGPLKKEIADFKRTVKCDNSDYLTGYICALSVVEGMIAEQPAADVVPVVHAHWIPQYVSKRGLSDFFTCSECDKSCFTYHKVKMCSNNFCPNCGARMDGDDNAKEN